MAGLAIAGGRALLRCIPPTAITRIAAAIMTALALLSLIKANRGK